MTSAFDVFGCDLAGINLIEASAGTGKTWNICALYMRLLLERALGVQQILVVTFTNAATAELRDRVRKRIVETRDYVQARGPLHDDAFVRALVTAAEASGVGRQETIDRLELALQSFDEAAIFTIHGFCQRALADAPFAAGAPFEVELLPNDNEIHLEVAQDFWRRRVADRDCPPALAAYLAQRRDSPDSFAELLKKRIAKPLAQLRFPDDLDSPVMLDVRPLELAYAHARSVWQGGRNEIAQTLDAQSGGLNRNHYKAEW